jgi:adenylate cyclase
MVMALFGAPVSHGFENDVRNAVAAAEDFVRLTHERNELRRAAGEEPIEVGIGLHCGEAVVGNLGTKHKIHYTAIGDTVNIASRVEGLTRDYGTPLLVTADIVAHAGGEWRYVDEAMLKGRLHSVKVYTR